MGLQCYGRCPSVRCRRGLLSLSRAGSSFILERVLGLFTPVQTRSAGPGAHVIRNTPGLTCRHTSANFLAVPGFCLETPGASGKVCKHLETSIGPSQKASFAGNGRTIGGNDNALDRPGTGTRVPPNLYHRGFRTSGFSLQHPIVAAGETIQRGVFQAWIDFHALQTRPGVAPKGQHPRKLSGKRTAAARTLWRESQGRCCIAPPHACRPGLTPGPGHDIQVMASGGCAGRQAGRHGPGLRRRVRSQAQIQRGRVFRQAHSAATGRSM